MANIKWHEVISWLQAGLTWFVIGLVAACVGVLILFDVLAGTGVNLYLTNDNLWVSLVISMATTGLLIALMFMGYQAQKSESFNLAGWVLLLFSLLLGGLHMMYRLLIGGVSVVGEPMALALITGMPVLVEIIEKSLQMPARRPTSPTQRYPAETRLTEEEQTIARLNRSRQHFAGKG